MYRPRTDSTSHRRVPQSVRPTPYRLPDPLESYEDWQRFQNADVDAMSPSERWAECQEARRALANLTRTGRCLCIVSPELEHIPAARWLAERIRATRTASP